MEEVQFLNFRKIFDGSCRKIALELNQLFGVELLSQSSASASRSYGLSFCQPRGAVRFDFSSNFLRQFSTSFCLHVYFGFRTLYLRMRNERGLAWVAARLRLENMIVVSVKHVLFCRAAFAAEAARYVIRLVQLLNFYV